MIETTAQEARRQDDLAARRRVVLDRLARARDRGDRLAVAVLESEIAKDARTAAR